MLDHQLLEGALQELPQRAALDRDLVGLVIEAAEQGRGRGIGGRRQRVGQLSVGGAPSRLAEEERGQGAR